MDRTNLYAAVEEKMSHVVLQARAMLERDLIKELPYDATDLANAGLGMIDASFRLACYHRDIITIPKLGTFQSVNNSVEFASEHKFNVMLKMISKLGALPEFGAWTEEEQQGAMQEITNEMAVAELNSDDLLKIISEKLVPLYLSASPQEIAETMLFTWEDTIVTFLKMGWRVNLFGIGKFSFHENEIQKIVFVPDPVLIHAIQAGDYRRQNPHLYSED